MLCAAQSGPSGLGGRRRSRLISSEARGPSPLSRLKWSIPIQPNSDVTDVYSVLRAPACSSRCDIVARQNVNDCYVSRTKLVLEILTVSNFSPERSTVGHHLKNDFNDSMVGKQIPLATGDNKSRGLLLCFDIASARESILDSLDIPSIGGSMPTRVAGGGLPSKESSPVQTRPTLEAVFPCHA